MHTTLESTRAHQPENPKKGYKGLPMEGFIARWYAKNTGKDIAEYQEFAQALTAELHEGASVLEVAPGPGYLAIELAKLGHYRIVGLDISSTFVQIAAENAKKAEVQVDFQFGDAAFMPLCADSFDLIVCRAAFKNFSAPVQALKEMHRVLKLGGKAIIADLRSDASAEAIDSYVRGKTLGWINSLITKWIFKHMLIKRAYTQDQFRNFVSQSPFKQCEIKEDPLGLYVKLSK
jgi:ubiquinone/menaquinone biosynthesis C-methylase UbiE